jgi:hypothetical protein
VPLSEASGARGCCTSRSSSSVSDGSIDTTRGLLTRSSTFHSSPFAVGSSPSAPLSDVRSQKLPTPPPSTANDPVSRDPAQELLLRVAPSTNCGDGLDPGGKRFCGLLQLLAYESLSTGSTDFENVEETVPCRVSYQLLRNLIDEQDSLGLENAAFTLKDGARVAMDGNGCCVDANVLVKVLEGLTTLNGGDHLSSASSMFLYD